MTLFVASQLKDDLRAATVELLSQLQSVDQPANLVVLFYVFDGGNGYFYIYVGRGWDPRTVVWRSVLDEPIAKEGSLGPVRQLHQRISQGLVTDVELLEDHTVVLEDGRTVAVASGDADFNDFLAKLTIEVLEEARIHELLCELRNPLGCMVYLADDEVMGHRRYVTYEVPE